MSSGFTAKPLALGQLLSDPYRFRIPSFQRPYSWTTKEAGQLLDDLTLALEEQAEDRASGDGEYFLGAMLLNIAGPSVASGTPPALIHDVVDGQQRLVTLTILLSVLRDLLAHTESELPPGLREHIECPKAMGQQRAYRLQLREREREFFGRHVQEPMGTATHAEADDLTEVERRFWRFESTS